MSNTWGKGSVNNNIGWGQAAGGATNNWGESQKTSWAGQTDIVGITSVSIAYSSSAFCADASDPTPTISNNAGVGTFSSTAGLVFISTTTGEVDISGSTAGTYVITYTDTDAATATFNLTINALPTVIVSVSAGTICDGESTILTASGASTYVWNDGNTDNPRTVSPTTTTLFTATGTDSNGCTSSGGTTITVNALPTVEISGTLTYCAGSTTTLTATAGLSSYLWSTGETTQAINVTAGSYTVTGTDSNGCSATSSASTVTELPLDSATVTYSAASYCQMPTGALAVDGYYPLYSTESAAQAESSDGTAHSHTLSGTTYYMPNDGVTIYHGTYSLTTPAPTITGETGTFSESTGNLSIDSSTGVINVNNSTAGTYTVVYTTNGSCPNTVNNTITVNALDGATFAYSSNSLPQTGTASLTTTPTTSGGVFSAYPSGLSINSSTGEIDLAASTIQSYKIFYETSGAGCPNSSTFDLAVTAASTFLLDNYGTDALLAVSMRKLRTNYTGFSMRIQRQGTAGSTGTADDQADLHFDSNNYTSLDSPITAVTSGVLSTTLGEFCAAPGYSNPDSMPSADTVEVVKFYNQTQNTAITDFPMSGTYLNKLVINGVLETITIGGSTFVALHSGYRENYSIVPGTSVMGGTPLSTFTVTNVKDPAGGFTTEGVSITPIAYSAPTGEILYDDTTDQLELFDQRNSNQILSSTNTFATDTPYLFSVLIQDAPDTTAYYVNNTLQASRTNFTHPDSANISGIRLDQNNKAAGPEFMEGIYYNASKETDLSSINQNIINYYNL